MFPIRDENPTLHRPIATLSIIGLNVLAWLLIQGGGSELPLLDSFCRFSLIPGDLFGNLPKGSVLAMNDNVDCLLDDRLGLPTLITHAFLHGSWFHIISNLWFLWIFGDNVEDVMGVPRYLAFYALCIIAAALAQVMANPSAMTPMVGASGAIGGVMGAYARLFPKAYVHTLIPLGFFITTAAIPAMYMLGYWFLIQFISALPAVGDQAPIAFWAHAGGFLAGLILIGPMHRPDYLAEHQQMAPMRTAKYRI